MHSFCWIFLWMWSSFFPVYSLECNASQYSWPNENPQFCCNMCAPGEYMDSRNAKICKIDCKPCSGKRYTDSYNVGDCKVCSDCNEVNMEYVSHCNSTHNAVCRCEAGFRCEDEACTYCLPLPSTTTLSLGTTVSGRETLPTPRATLKPIKDTAWFLVIITLLCVSIALVVVTKIKPIGNWFNYNKGYCLNRKPGVPVYIEEVDACQPVQEMCGKCDQLIDLTNV